jgi:catabolite regulation protein CreA
MIQRRHPNLFDMVAVLEPPPGESIEVGDVGTVVELLAPDAVEVEFLDPDGRTRCVATLPVSDVLVLNRDRTPIN